jgi:hypothetical protein
VEPWFTNASHHEQIFLNKTSWVTKGVLSNEHASRQQRLATSWEYWRKSASCCVTFAQYTSLLEFAVPSLEFHCVLWFLYILLNKTPWEQRSFGLRTFRVTNGLQERIKFVNLGFTVQLMCSRRKISSVEISLYLQMSIILLLWSPRTHKHTAFGKSLCTYKKCQK